MKNYGEHAEIESCWTSGAFKQAHGRNPLEGRNKPKEEEDLTRDLRKLRTDFTPEEETRFQTIRNTDSVAPPSHGALSSSSASQPAGPPTQQATPASAEIVLPVPEAALGEPTYGTVGWANVPHALRLLPIICRWDP